MKSSLPAFFLIAMCHAGVAAPPGAWAAETATAPAADAVTAPVAGAATAPAAETATAPAAETATALVAEAVTAPVAGAVTAPTAETATTPAAETATVMASTLWTASDPPRTQSFDLGVAFGYRAARDDLLVPLVFQGPDLQIDARYRHRVGPGFLNGAVDFGLGLVMDRHLHLGLSIDHALRLGYLRRLPKSGSRYLALGPVIGIGADALYPDRWDDAHLYWIGTGWAGLGLERSRPLAGGWRLTASAELALAGLVSRPPIYRLEKQDPLNRVGFHLFGIHRDSTLEWINTYQHARLAFDLDRFKRPSLLRRSIGLEAKLVRVADPELAVAFQASVRYSIGLGR